MRVSVETITELERKINITVPADEIDSKVSEKLNEVAKRAHIRGFRKGKVPFKVIQRQYGASARQEIAGDVVNHSYRQALLDHDVRPAGNPSIEIITLESGKDFEFTAVVEVLPEIVIQDLSDREVTIYQADIQDSDIDQNIEMIRQQHASYQEVDRVAQMGDRVIIDFIGTKDGKEFDGGQGEDVKLDLGSNTMIPGFEEGIVGMLSDASRTLDLTFPDDYQVDDLKGADVAFKITVKKVEEKILPEINEEFLQKFGTDNLDDFRENLRASLDNDLKQTLKNKNKSQVMEMLAEAHSITLPKALVDAEINELRQQMLKQFGDMSKKSMDFEALLPAKMFHDEANKRVLLGLLVTQIAKDHSIKAEPQRVRSYIEELAHSYSSPEQVVNYYYENPKLLSSIESAVIEDMVIEQSQGSMKHKVIQTTYEDLKKN